MSTKILSIVLFGLLCAAACVHASDDSTGGMGKGGFPSPDGSKVVLEADPDGTGRALHLWVSNRDGSGFHRLVTGMLSEGDPSWSPDGSLIAFEALGPQGNTDIWTIHPDGSGLMQLTQGLDNQQPAWSPDGRKIAFVSNRGGTNDLWVMDANGQNVQRLTSLPGEEDHPSFSPSGDRLVFSETERNGYTASLYIVGTIAGANPQAITGPGFHDWNPSWGTQGILFSSDRTPGGHHYIWQVQPDGSGLTSVDSVISLDPVWTPDGKIIFTDEINVNPALALVSEYDTASKQRRRIAPPIVSVHQAGIVIKPKPGQGAVNPSDDGKIWVAMLSASDLNAPQDIDPSTLTFGQTGSEQSLVDCRNQARDVNGDGKADLECRFDVQAAGLSAATPVGVARFKTKAGLSYEGHDAFNPAASASQP